MFRPTALLDWIAFRSRTVYRLTLSALPNPRVPAKPEQNLTLVSMCGARYLGLLQQSLHSLYWSWSALPRLHIVSDGSISVSRLQQALSWWPGTKAFSHWEESVAYHAELGRHSIVQFAQSNIMGKKLAVILKAGETGPTLWCDSDILWFKDFLSIPRPSESGSLPVLKIAEDYQPSYDPRMIEYGLKHLKTPPYRNAGLIYIQGELINSCNLQSLLDLAAAYPCNDAEQTIFAEANYQLNSGIWSSDEIACFADDREQQIPQYSGKQWVARHYVGPVRHLFWRDALLLRLGLKDQLFKPMDQPSLVAKLEKLLGGDRKYGH